MSSNYTGSETATQAPATAPAWDNSPIVVIPADGDAANAASVAQAMKEPADVLDFLLRHADNRDYQPGVRFRENWIGYASTTIQPPAPWRFISAVPDGANTFAATALVGVNAGAPSIQIDPGHTGTASGFLVTAEDDGAGGLIANSGGFLDTGSIVALATRAVLSWRGLISVGGANLTRWFMGWCDAAETLDAYAGGVAPGTPQNGIFFYKASADTNWKAITVNGTAATTTDTGIAGDSTWREFKIDVLNVAGTPTARFYINGVLVATHTATWPDIGTRIGFGGARTSGTPTSYMLIGPVAARVNVP